MGFPSKPFFCYLFLSPSLFVSLSPSAPDYSTSVYKGCAQQAFQDPNGVYSQAISALFGSIVSQSTKTKFFKTTTETGLTTITGLFHCQQTPYFNRQTLWQNNSGKNSALWMLAVFNCHGLES
jgi:hypothetical protein